MALYKIRKIMLWGVLIFTLHIAHAESHVIKAGTKSPPPPQLANSKTDSIHTKDIEQKIALSPEQIETKPYPLLHEDSKKELFATIKDEPTPNAIPAPLTKSMLGVLEEWRDSYFIYIYNFSPMDKPEYIPNELKGQISFRVPIVRNIFKSGAIFYFAFTDTFFFQVFNERASSPVRDNDFQPEFLITYPMNLHFWGGTLTELTTGWRHISNGEVGEKSRGSDRWIFKARWSTKHWGVDMEAFAPVRFYPENPLIYKYMGALEVKIFMRYGKHLADVSLNGLLREPKWFFKAHGGVRVSYTYKLNPYYGIYMQYFYGYGDYLYEYDSVGHRIGLGVRFVR